MVRSSATVALHHLRGGIEFGQCEKARNNSAFCLSARLPTPKTHAPHRATLVAPSLWWAAAAAAARMQFDSAAWNLLRQPTRRSVVAAGKQAVDSGSMHASVASSQKTAAAASRFASHRIATIRLLEPATRPSPRE